MNTANTIDLYDAIKSVETIATAPDSALNNPKMYMNHILGELIYGEHIVRMINDAEQLENGLDIDLMDLCFIYHDVGRPFTYGLDIHEINSGIYLRSIGLDEIADIVQRHFVSYEKAKEIIIPQGIADIEPLEFIQSAWEPKVLTYVDLCVDSSGKYIGWEKKIDSFVEKYSSPERASPDMVKILEAGGLDRMKDICEEVEGLFEIIF
ncbi:MAG: HD domain-containing protein [Nanohaloarchaea archaeon]|nr:HD domain-containing protein [Candidatus Nanohaloarchaea archaeon]